MQEIQSFLNQHLKRDENITDIHDIRVVETENHHVILFGINVKVRMLQKEIVDCCQSLEVELKQKFSGFEINIKVSPLHRY